MTDTDPVPPEDEGPRPYGFLARLIGLPILEERLLDAIGQLIPTAADVAALEAARDSLAAADSTIDNIEKGTP